MRFGLDRPSNYTFFNSCTVATEESVELETRLTPSYLSSDSFVFDQQNGTQVLFDFYPSRCPHNQISGLLQIMDHDNDNATHVDRDDWI